MTTEKRNPTWFRLVVDYLAICAWIARNRLALLAWIVMAVCQAILFAIHAHLDALLDSSSQTILQRQTFAISHEWYEFTSAIQWLFAMLFIGFWLFYRDQPKSEPV